MSVNICIGSAGLLDLAVELQYSFFLIFFFNSLSLTARKGVEWNNKKNPQSLVNVGFPVLDYESSRKVYFGEGHGESF